MPRFASYDGTQIGYATRGSGQSDDASDPLSYRCDRIVGDMEALRAHLGLDRMDLLAHSAAGDLAVLYAAAYPQRLAHLILLDPGLAAVGIDETEDQWRAALERRSAEPWFLAALAAVQRAEAGDESLANRRAFQPFLYGRWDARADVRGRARQPADPGGGHGGRGRFPAGHGDGTARGRALPLARRSGLLHRRDDLFP